MCRPAIPISTPTGELKIYPAVGKEQIILFARDNEFPMGEVFPGKRIIDRVIHPWYEFRRNGKRKTFAFDWGLIVIRTIDIETK